MSPTAAARPFVLPLPAAAIERPRLSAALDASREAAFTLVVAPPGWGKSVALGSWAAGCGAAWLTLSRWHSDAPRLWTDVLAALRRSEAPVDGLDAPSGALDDDFPLRLADALADAPARPTLVLDDLHLLRGPGLASLARAGRGRRRRAARRRGHARRSRAAARAPATRRPARGAARRATAFTCRRGDRASLRGARRRAAAGSGAASPRADRRLGGRPAAGGPLAARRARPGGLRVGLRGRRPRHRRLPDGRGAHRGCRRPPASCCCGRASPSACAAGSPTP